MAKGCPCNGCGRRTVGCHSSGPEYQAWKQAYENEKAVTREEVPEMSRSKKRHLWRMMLRR